MRSNANAVKRAIVITAAVICTTRYSAFNAIIWGTFFMIHVRYLLSKIQ